MQQQTLNRDKLIRNNPLSPIEILQAEKNVIEEKCRVQKKKLDDDFVYIKDNVSSLLLSGVSTLLFPPKSTSIKAGDQLAISSGGDGKNAIKSSTLSISDYFTITKSLLPVAWEVLQPIIIAWGIKKAKSMIAGFFSEKKRPTLHK
jgi:hypothetical protein